jgi:DNA (cytosine-5)-methyltransferase 1
MLNGLDLFSGYGGAQDALRGLVRPIAYCEIELGAKRILLRRMRKRQITAAPIWDDVRTLQRRHIAAPIDIITGGFPCQDVSAAGMRKGLGGKRSGLFFEIIRLAREFKPTFIFLENVPGLFVRGIDRVCAELAQAGYDHRWGVLSAYDMGACHQRERVWILAYAKGERRRKTRQLRHNEFEKWSAGGGIEATPNSDCKILWKQQKQFEKCETSAITRISSIASDASNAPSFGSQGPWRGQEHSAFIKLLYDPRGVVKPTVRRGDDGYANRCDRIRALGNGWVPQTAREAFKRLIGFKEEAKC